MPLPCRAAGSARSSLEGASTDAGVSWRSKQMLTDGHTQCLEIGKATELLRIRLSKDFFKDQKGARGMWLHAKILSDIESLFGVFGDYF